MRGVRRKMARERHVNLCRPKHTGRTSRFPRLARILYLSADTLPGLGIGSVQVQRMGLHAYMHEHRRTICSLSDRVRG